MARGLTRRDVTPVGDLSHLKISVSLATFEFKPSGAGAKLIMTEQVAFLDGYDDNGNPERGSRDIMDKLSVYLEG